MDMRSFVTEEQLISGLPPQPPYLQSPPKVIRIGVGRNLFVDDYLISWTNASRTFHQAVHRAVVLRPTEAEILTADLEQNNSQVHAGYRVHSARPMSGGVWYDANKGRFVMHYRCVWLIPGRGRGCVAYSDDGVHWTRPRLHNKPDNSTAAGTWQQQSSVDGGGCQDSKKAQRGEPGSPPAAPRLPNELLMRAPSWMLREGGQLCNKVVPSFSATESFTTWLDARPETPPAERWKGLVRYWKHTPMPQVLWVSADGEHWQPMTHRAGHTVPLLVSMAHRAVSVEIDARPSGREPSRPVFTGQVTDRAGFFHDPFRERWVFEVRDNLCRGGVSGHLRVALIREAQEGGGHKWADLRTHAGWRYQHVNHTTQFGFFCSSTGRAADSPAPWYGADSLDCGGDSACDLYHLDAIAYESVLLGQLAILNSSAVIQICKSTDLHLAFSRDGFHWSRADELTARASPLPRRRTPNASAAQQSTDSRPARVPAVGVSEIGRYRQPVAGNFLVVGDEIYFYYGGVRTSTRSCEQGARPGAHQASARIMACCDEHGPRSEETALAVFRRDGFASLGPPVAPERPPSKGSLRGGGPVDATYVVITRALSFARGAFLFVNADATNGEVRVGVRLAGGAPAAATSLAVAPLASEACLPLRRVNGTKLLVTWRGVPPHALQELQGKELRIHFILRRARLYSFWVSPTLEGRSSGYMAGGGPGFVGGMDRDDPPPEALNGAG